MRWVGRSDANAVAVGDYSEMIQPGGGPHANWRGVLVLHGGGSLTTVGEECTHPLLPGSGSGSDLNADLMGAVWRATLIPHRGHQYVFLSTNHGGSLSWGHGVAMDGLDAAYTALIGSYGDAQASDKVALFGLSMGHITACNWAKRNPRKVAGIIGFLSASDLSWHRGTDASPGDWYTSINYRYGGSGTRVVNDRHWTRDVAPKRDPLLFASELASFPHWCAYQTDDTIVPPATVLDFVDERGTDAVAVAAGTGAHAAWTLTDRQFQRWLDACDW